MLEGYGLSETSPVASFNQPHAERKPGSIGTPIRGVEMRLVDDDGKDVGTGDVGEIAIRGENVMKGYWNRPEDTQAAIPDGWFRTGDMAAADLPRHHRQRDAIDELGLDAIEDERVRFLVSNVVDASAPSNNPMLNPAAIKELIDSGGTSAARGVRAFVRDMAAKPRVPRMVEPDAFEVGRDPRHHAGGGRPPRRALRAGPVPAPRRRRCTARRC